MLPICRFHFSYFTPHLFFLLQSILSFRHVALLTDFFCSLAELQPKLKRSVIAVFIVNEENGLVEGIGADKLDEIGKVVCLFVCLPAIIPPSSPRITE